MFDDAGHLRSGEFPGKHGLNGLATVHRDFGNLVIDRRWRIETTQRLGIVPIERLDPPANDVRWSQSIILWGGTLSHHEICGSTPGVQRGTSSVVVFLRRGRLNPCTYFFEAGVLYLRA